MGWLRNTGESGVRTLTAISIVTLSVVGMVVISVVALNAATGTDRPETARLIFSSILPLLGTRVGTVLAFYFARENLEAERLINWGYAVTDAAVRRHVLPDAPPPAGFPYPASGV